MMQLVYLVFKFFFFLHSFAPSLIDPHVPSLYKQVEIPILPIVLQENASNSNGDVLFLFPSRTLSAVDHSLSTSATDLRMKFALCH